jgi:hypothetical protein
MDQQQGLLIDQLGGAVARVDEDYTAVSNRLATCRLTLTDAWDAPAEAGTARTWVRDSWTAVRPRPRDGADASGAETPPAGAAGIVVTVGFDKAHYPSQA